VVEPATIERFKTEAQRLGFDVSGLIMVDQSAIE
jgi:lipocalin